jgi:hypothetical protein
VSYKGYTLEIVKMKKGWAQKATIGNESRDRTFYYKKDAERNLDEWVNFLSADDFMRDFHHNFNSLEELGATEDEGAHR